MFSHIGFITGVQCTLAGAERSPTPSSVLWWIGTSAAGAKTVAFSSLRKLEEQWEKVSSFYSGRIHDKISHYLTSEARIISIINYDPSNNLYFSFCEKNWNYFSGYRRSHVRNHTSNKLAALLCYCLRIWRNECVSDGRCWNLLQWLLLINHHYIAIPQGGREIPSIAGSNYAFWAPLQIFGAVLLLGAVVGFMSVCWTAWGDVTPSILLFSEHIFFGEQTVQQN